LLSQLGAQQKHKEPVFLGGDQNVQRTTVK